MRRTANETVPRCNENDRSGRPIMNTTKEAPRSPTSLDRRPPTASRHGDDHPLTDTLSAVGVCLAVYALLIAMTVGYQASLAAAGW